MSTLANNKQSCSKSGKFQAKIVFFLFFRRKNWHDFVTPFSTLANIKAQGLPPDLFDHARSIAIGNQNRR